ncbi:MAG TPA: hypothetical protein VEX35_04640 [Allosphingosinicella sp.]|nr:hypothetical protein [Allosphingosinicella sp.]
MKAQDLLLGVRDFFAVLIPGAVLLFVLTAVAALDEVAPEWLVAAASAAQKQSAALKLSETGNVFVFAIAAYAAGQIVSAASSLLDWPVDWFERTCGRWSIGNPLLRRLDPRVRLWRFRCLAMELKDEATWALLWPDASRTDRPERRSNCFDDRFNPLWSVRSFWRDYLRLNKPDAIAELDRIESAQKMFRSLGVVLLAMAGILAPSLSTLQLAGTALLFLLCYLLFVRFRLAFFYRLYKLALLTTLPEGHVEKSAGAFFERIPDLLNAIEPRPARTD